ncbi:leucine-rich repeat receptor-like protein kinase PEPR2 [Gossypium australe]|uniref:Leucine-rich repeat receptor-like protein kinase PEPR2 n=1 Tax=Gossypium australe TaxID=47621 RepID=A0A5B6WUJ4_9ROSI|nr:leucine-rich repeat receptor-like protein kinase PEPR2 [Gossypium australe]
MLMPQYSEGNIAIYRAMLSFGSSLKGGYCDTQKGYHDTTEGCLHSSILLEASRYPHIPSVKKVRIPELKGDSDVAMGTISTTDKNFSWKDCLLGNGLRVGERTETIKNVEGEEDFELLESDIVLLAINEIPSIYFSERVNKLLIKDMARTVVIKLLRRNIRYSALYNKPYPRERIGKVAKLDFNIDAGVRERFTRMAVCMNLEKPLVSQVLVDGIIQQVEYKYLSTVYFSCGHYNHTKKFCPTYANGAYGSRMLVERQGRRSSRVVKADSGEGIGALRNSRFNVLETLAHFTFRNKPTKPAERMRPSRGKSEVSTKGGLEMNPKDGEGPNGIIARVRDLELSHLEGDAVTSREA